MTSQAHQESQSIDILSFPLRYLIQLMSADSLLSLAGVVLARVGVVEEAREAGKDPRRLVHHAQVAESALQKIDNQQQSIITRQSTTLSSQQVNR